jgi:hypothetical protein
LDRFYRFSWKLLIIPIWNCSSYMHMLKRTENNKNSRFTLMKILA